MKLPRRVPRQARSKDTSEVIVEAAARVFAEVGLVKATTTRVAEVAGVSVGSLYQYFPDKQAIVLALFERQTRRLEAEFIGLVSRRGLDDVHALVRDYVEITVEALERDAPLFLVLLEEVPRIGGLGPTQAVDHDVAKRLRLLLELAGPRIAPRDREMAALLIVRTLRYNTIPILREPLEGRRRESFIDELAAMICAYLFAPSDRWAGHRSE